jgi:glutathione S-transferase
MVLAESGIPYRLHPVDLARGEHQGPDYLAINPKGFVPSLITPAGNILTETGAMLLHLADLEDVKGLVPQGSDPDRGQFLDWFFYHLTMVQEPYKRIYFARRYVEHDHFVDDIIQTAKTDLEKHWTRVEAHLTTNGPFHLGERFTMNDILLATYAVFMSWKPKFFETYPAVSRCYERVKSRPALHDILFEHEGV